MLTLFGDWLWHESRDVILVELSSQAEETMFSIVMVNMRARWQLTFHFIKVQSSITSQKKKLD